MVSDANTANHGRVRAIMYPGDKKPATAPAPAAAPAQP